MKKNSIKRSISALLAVTLMGVGFTGCGKKESESVEPILADTVLENGFVVYVDEEPLIMTYENLRQDGGRFGWRCTGKHYRDIITGTYYHVPHPENIDERCAYGIIDGVNILPLETEINPISNELTKEELQKANEGKFTDEDVISVQQRLAKK